jgi:hypothetical protein
MSKWYEGLSPANLTIEFSRMYQNTCANALQGDKKQAEKCLDEFEEKFNEVIPMISDLKSAHYKVNDATFTMWENCMNDIKYIKSQLKKDLQAIYI